jgi:hypothetical protein
VVPIHQILASGFQVHLLTECTLSREPYNKKIALRKMQMSGAILSSVEMALFELMRDANHARRALECGLAMQKALRELDPVFAKKRWPALRIGVGINCGTMSVGRPDPKMIDSTDQWPISTYSPSDTGTIVRSRRRSMARLRSPVRSWSPA